MIGADGVHSLIRDYVAGPEQPRFVGRLAYRTTFPAALLRGVEVGSSRTKWWGADRHIVIYFVTAARDEVYFTTSQPEQADWITKESWSAKGDLERDARGVCRLPSRRPGGVERGARGPQVGHLRA